MRVSVNLISPRAFVLSTDYRGSFISLLKTVFTKSKAFSELYGSKRTKPFTFSIWLGDKFGMEVDKIQASENILLLFSTGDPEVLANFYNGLLNLKKGDQQITFGDDSVKIDKVVLLPIKKIRSKKILFRTLGISILTNPEESPKNFKKWYLIPNGDLESFNIALKKRTNDRYSYITGIKKDFDIHLRPLTDDEFRILKLSLNLEAHKKSITETLIKFYGGYLRGFRGFFWLEGDEEILQFVYDYGLGVRTGQGFGLLDIITEA